MAVIIDKLLKNTGMVINTKSPEFTYFVIYELHNTCYSRNCCILVKLNRTLWVWVFTFIGEYYV